MRLIDICRHPVISVDHAAPLCDAARLMRRHHVGALVVTRAGEGGTEIAGVVTDRDLAIEALARDLDAATVGVGGVASGSVVSAPADASLEEGAHRMQEAGVRRLLVHTATGELAGIVSFDDIVEACAATLSDLAGVLGKGFQRETSQRPGIATAARLHVPAIGTMGWQPGDRLDGG